MDKAYDHNKYEEHIYKMWEESGAFRPDEKSTKKPFTIIMPPPNANDDLHIGHARFVAIEDILIRYHRMKGEAALWLPGADHAGIETQYVFEKKLKEQGESRFDFDRDTLYKMIWDYVQENKTRMENQLRRLGASCDWDRNKFTLDPDIVKVVLKTFKKLDDDNLLYRDEKLVNYCTKCGTAYSDLEVDRVERIDPLYYMKYGPFVLATTRPETKFGDTAVAVHPRDKRYKKFVGREIEVEGLIGKFKVKVIADESVDMEFGTGVVKITPSHDFNDYEIGKKHHLEMKQVIDYEGKLNEKCGKYQGLKVIEARNTIVEDLKAAGMMVKIDENYQHVIGLCYRCKTVIEPLPYQQWFIKVKDLATKAKTAVEKGQTKFAAKKFEKIYNHWLDNLRDWNISRQIVWGVLIPAWYCRDCNKWTITAGEIPEKCKYCGSKNIERDKDTFDTWFSSGQWPFATLQTTHSGDFEKFYPTSVMETAYDILPFWVMRMMMLGIYATGKVPFENILIHGLVRDKNGQKISKSKGNVINPLEMTEKYGADAVRVSLVWGALIENDISLSEDNIRGQKFFANKIWNAARFVVSMDGDLGSRTDKFSNKTDKIAKSITEKMNNFELSYAIEELYEKFWHWYCDECIEKAKKRELSKADLVHGLITFLKLLHPFMPFVTEAVWQELRKEQKTGMLSEMLITSKWPEV
jgi:valyl-tRNA synthetase